MRQERFTSKNAHHDILKNVIKEEIPMSYSTSQNQSLIFNA